MATCAKAFDEQGQNFIAAIKQYAQQNKADDCTVRLHERERLLVLIALEYATDNYEDLQHRHVRLGDETTKFDNAEYACAPSSHEFQKLVHDFSLENR